MGKDNQNQNQAEVTKNSKITKLADCEEDHPKVTNIKIATEQNPNSRFVVI